MESELFGLCFDPSPASITILAFKGLISVNYIRTAFTPSRFTFRHRGFATLMTLAFLFLISQSCYGQWEVKQLNMQVGKQFNGEAVFAGNLDNSNHKLVVWYMSAKKGDDRINILDPQSGDIRWQTEGFYKIDKSTILLSDLDGDGKDEILFSGLKQSSSSPALYIIKHIAGSFAQTTAPPIKKPAPPVETQSNPPASDIKTVSGGPSSSAPASDTAVSQAPLRPVTYLAENAKASIEYTVTQHAVVRIDIFNGTGDIVRTLLNDESEPGTFRITWDGRNDLNQRLASGSYFYKVTIGKLTLARRPVVFN